MRSLENIKDRVDETRTAAFNCFGYACFAAGLTNKLKWVTSEEFSTICLDMTILVWEAKGAKGGPSYQAGDILIFERVSSVVHAAVALDETHISQKYGLR